MGTQKSEGFRVFTFYQQRRLSTTRHLGKRQSCGLSPNLGSDIATSSALTFYPQPMIYQGDSYNSGSYTVTPRIPTQPWSYLPAKGQSISIRCSQVFDTPLLNATITYTNLNFWRHQNKPSVASYLQYRQQDAINASQISRIVPTPMITVVPAGLGYAWKGDTTRNNKDVALKRWNASKLATTTKRRWRRWLIAVYLQECEYKYWNFPSSTYRCSLRIIIFLIKEIYRLDGADKFQWIQLTPSNECIQKHKDGKQKQDDEQTPDDREPL